MRRRYIKFVLYCVCFVLQAPPAAGGKTEQELAEEEELQLALAISKSEADEKEKNVSAHLIT